MKRKPFFKVAKVHEPATCTTILDEVKPEKVGLSQASRTNIWKSIQKLYRTGLHPAMAICIRRHGQVFMHRSIGYASGAGPHTEGDETKKLAHPHQLYNVFSISKCITAMLVHLLDQRGLLHIGDAVEEYIPEFGQHGKRWITIRHILSHRAGFPAIPGEHADVNLLTQPDKIMELICAGKTNTRPGKRLAYHALTGGFVLGEIIERVTGKPVQQVLQEEVCEPLGLKHFAFGVPDSNVLPVAKSYYTGPPPLFPYGNLLKASIGADIRDAVTHSNGKIFQKAVIPAGNIFCTPNDMCIFFECLLRNGTYQHKEIFQRTTIRRAVSEQSYLELDTTLMMPVRYGLGFMLGGKYWSFFGPKTTHTFGHLGFTNVLAFACPERNISVSFMNTGKPFVTLKQLSWVNVMNTIAKQIPRDRVSIF